MLPGCGSINFGTLAIVILESEEGKKNMYLLDKSFSIFIKTTYVISFQALNQLERFDGYKNTCLHFYVSYCIIKSVNLLCK